MVSASTSAASWAARTTRYWPSTPGAVKPTRRAPSLEKNAPIPIERTKVFTTARDHQSRVVIDCCRGEAKKFVDNEPIGHLVLDELPPRPRGQVRIEVTFRVDTDGILHVRARDADTGAKQEAQLAVIGAPVREVA
jgi:molecular chaperone DnaK